MSLLDHAIWWQVYPLTACGAPIHLPDQAASPQRDAHRLPRLLNWLDYAIELGCSGLLLGPVLASTSHGYDTLDHFRIDPRLGDDADFDALITAARERGLAIMLDGVFNHVGVHHELVTSGSPLIKRDATGAPLAWEGNGDLALLDHSRPEVADLVVDVMTHWLRKGIAGWRLDVAYAVPTWFWAGVTDRVRTEFPAAIFLGEMIHGEFAQFAAASHLDSTTQYELWKAIWSSIHDQNLWELAWALQRNDEFQTPNHQPQTFVGNHDVSRIASVVGDQGAAVAAALLLTLPGMPSIYYGDEQGFRGEKGSGYRADDPMRPELPDQPEQLATEGRWLFRWYQQLIGYRRRHAWLARARVEVLDKQNESISYRVNGDGHWVQVEIELGEAATVSISADDGEELAWPNPQA